MKKLSIKELWGRFQQTLPYKIGRFLANSAAIALLITAILFIYQEYEEQERADKIIENLQGISGDLLDVQKSVSTRYLGIFPDYLEEINGLYDGIAPEDSVVVFEDVLYYGFLSRPEAFTAMNRKMISHADAGGKVTIVYYNPAPRSRIFHQMMRDLLISPEFFGDMVFERRRQTGSRESHVSIRQRLQEDSLMCRRFFALTREKDLPAFTRTQNRMLKPIASINGTEDELGMELQEVWSRIDSLKNFWLGKNPMEVDFFDYENLYRGMSHEMEVCYSRHGIELVALDEYITMSCWLVGGKAVLAFPSKWATDEIGFFSQDPAFTRYITTMLAGARGQIGQVE